MLSPDLDIRLDALRATDKLPGTLIDAFKETLREAPEDRLFRMSPLTWAAERRAPEQQAIDLFLHATHAGILEFAWGILCPGCMGFLTTPGALRSVQKKHCNFCDIDVERALDDWIEVAFTVAPSVRRIRFHSPEALDLRRDGLRLYFSSSLSPESLPHRSFGNSILHADRVPPGATQTVTIDFPKGMTAMLAPACHACTYFRVAEDEDCKTTASLEIFDGRALPEKLSVRAGPVEVSIRNRMSHPAGYIVSPVAMEVWPMPVARGKSIGHPHSPYLTGPRLIASQAFRDLFRAESIPSEGGLELKGATLLFTDLKGSTAIYERVGDIRAFDLVRRHFTTLHDIAAAEGGSIVKTIGDAVMASFADPLSAMRAATRMTRAVERLGEGDLHLKIGLHTGPCIAVELNDRLDYFGRTVNIAARVQGLAGPGEIVCTASVFEASGVRELIEREGFSPEHGAQSLRGIAGEVAVARLTSESR